MPTDSIQCTEINLDMTEAWKIEKLRPEPSPGENITHFLQSVGVTRH